MKPSTHRALLLGILGGVNIVAGVLLLGSQPEADPFGQIFIVIGLAEKLAGIYVIWGEWGS